MLSTRTYVHWVVIGVSKRCCFLCDFVIKALQKADAPYTPDNAGHPLLLALRGTHGGIMPNWWFPDLRVFNSSTLAPLQKRQLQHRLGLIRQDLSVFLQSKVAEMLKHILDVKARDPESEDQSSSDEASDEDASKFSDAFDKVVSHRKMRWTKIVP
ncbi:hypothetical protein B0H10DRAFT_1131642 [Mycena sp. CBHHK59/15]|nr:hypothetical protein B0H10DRAFT_1131642 [Mycena sp. CBHHK59/15]